VPGSVHRLDCKSRMAVSAIAILGMLTLLSGAENDYRPRSSNAPPPPSADVLPLEPELACSDAADQPSSGYSVMLTPEQESRSRDLYRDSLVITAHDHCFHARDFEDMRRAGITVRTIKPIVDGIYWHDAKRYRIDSEIEGWEQRGTNALRILDRQIAARQGETIGIRSVDDIYRAKRENKLGVIYSFEGARALAGKIENLRKFHDLGLRELQLFWSVPSPLKNPNGTLSDFGLQVIREMNRLGILVDLSHMGNAAFEQAIAASSKPVVISHCGMASVSGKPPRGSDDVSDDNIRRIAQNKGVLCVHFYEGYIRPHHGPHATVEDIVDHIDYVRKLVGIDYAALGVDYFPERGWRWAEGAEHMEYMPNVLREMVRRGFTDGEIRKVLGENLIRVYREVWKE
jgi:membrane dipeptidase